MRSAPPSSRGDRVEHRPRYRRRMFHSIGRWADRGARGRPARRGGPRAVEHARQRQDRGHRPRKLRRPGIDAHRIAIAPDEVTVEDGIPVTTPARTLFDLAAVVTPDQLEHAFNEADYRRLTSPVSLDALVSRYPGRRGTQAIRRVLDNHRKNGETRTRSDLERRLLTLLDAHGLPRPIINRQSDYGE